MNRRRKGFIVGILVSLVVAGFAVASNSALPGDAFYPVKISVIEPALSLLAFTPAAKAESVMTHAESRLLEAEQLAGHGALHEAQKEMLTKAFAGDAAQTVDAIDGLSRTDVQAGITLHALFTTSLSAHAVVLKGMPQEQVGTLLAELAKTQDSLTVVGTRTTRAFLAARSRVEEADARRGYDLALAEVNAVGSGNGGLHGAAGEGMQLVAAKDALSAAKDKLDAQAFGEAFELALRARSQAQAAQVLAHPAW